MNINRGDIFLACLDPVIGHEISKTRPVIVVSNDIGNQHSGTVTVIPVTSKNLSKIYPFEIYLPREESHLGKNSKGKADQIRTIDKTRLIKPIGKLTPELMGSMEKAVKVHLDLKEILEFSKKNH